MIKPLVLLLACLGCAAAQGRSLVIQESARLTNPDPSYPEFGGGVAIDGDDSLVVLRRYNPPNDELGVDEREDIAVWLFRRVNGTWTAIRQLEATSHGLEYIWNGDVAMQGGIAALAINPLSIYERRNGNWVQVVDNVLGDEPGTSVEIDNGRVIFGGSAGTYMGTVFERDPATGQWRQAARLLGAERGGDIENSGGPVDISGSRAVVFSLSTDNPDMTPGVTVYRFTSTFGWQQEGSSIPGLLDLWPLGRESAVRGDDVFISGNSVTGTHVFRRQTSGCCDWWPEDHLQPLDGFMGGGQTNIIKKNDAFVMQNSWSADHQANVINVFLINNDTGLYRHVATLTASGGESLGAFGISGRRVMARCGDEVCYFELPEDSLALPARIQEVFAGNTPTGWTLSAGSRFGILRTSVSQVLRQAETQSPATHTARLDASNWSNQSIQADIQPNSFNGADRWFGLATRWRNAANYYYVTVRSSGRVSLRRNVGGVFRELASAPLSVTLNRTYKVRLESVGTRHRVYVDGVPLLDADDDSLASGRAALMTFHTAADFDNVIVSPTPTVTMYAFDLERPFESDPGYFTESGLGLWLDPNETGNSFMRQASVAGDARAVTGVPADDQSIEVRARATTFAGTGSGDRWFGIAARYVDTANYFYLSARSNNTVSLRKVNNGTITILGTVPMPITLGQWYRLRLEVVGVRVRAYVNGRLRLEATDATLPRGVTGFVTFRTAADFDDYRAIQP
jgi:hypothetical protein